MGTKRERLKKLLSRAALPAWVIVVWNAIDALGNLQTMRDLWFATLPYLSPVLGFLRDWGWIGGLAWLAYLVLRKEKAPIPVTPAPHGEPNFRFEWDKKQGWRLRDGEGQATPTEAILVQKLTNQDVEINALHGRLESVNRERDKWQESFHAEQAARKALTKEAELQRKKSDHATKLIQLVTGEEPALQFAELDELGKRDVRQRLEQLDAAFSVAVERAVGALQNMKKQLWDKGNHAHRVVAGLLDPPLLKLLTAQKVFRDTLQAKADARHAFLLAYLRYQDVARLVGDTHTVYPGRFTEMHYEYWRRDNETFQSAANSAFAISEFSDLRERMRAYKPGANLPELYEANFI